MAGLVDVERHFHHHLRLLQVCVRGVGRVAGPHHPDQTEPGIGLSRQPHLHRVQHFQLGIRFRQDLGCLVGCTDRGR